MALAAVVDTFTITEYPSLVQGNFTVVFRKDGVVATPSYVIANGGGGAYTITWTPSATGSWFVSVVYQTYKFEQTYEIGPLDPDLDIPVDSQPLSKNGKGDLMYSDRVTLADGQSRRITLPRDSGNGYSVAVQQVENRGASISVKEASTYFDISCKMHNTLAGNRTTVVVEYTVFFWKEHEEQHAQMRTDLRRMET